MPRRSDLNSVLVIGSGPIVIGQGCEFDYSGTQACRVLKAEGIRVSLVNSNPATIMTDPEFADRTYVEPITAEVLEKVIAIERPDAVLPTLGGQTALNAAVELHESGVLARYNTELIGARIDAIKAGEDRERFKEIVTSLPPMYLSADDPGQVPEVPDSRICHSLEGVLAAAGELGFPVVVRPSYTLGGSGSGIARDEEELRRIAGAGLDASPVTEVLLEESILGWKEFELELMRDRHDNVVVVCSIENIDPMGVHTGDSVTVAPAMTLTDREYQRMRDTAIAIVRAVGVDTGGCNIQFAVDPLTGRMVVIEMNPRVSRSSALASKATGFPIAKIAAKLAIGYTLDEIPNDITGQTPASFEPALDYVVVKTPRFAFEKFPGADPEPDHAHEVGRRGHGHRAVVPRGAAEGAALDGIAGCAVQLGRSSRRQERPAAPGAGPARRPAGHHPPGPARRGERGRDRGRQRHRPLVRRADRLRREHRPAGPRAARASTRPRWPGQGGRVLRRADRPAARDDRGTASGRSAGASACGPCTTRWTPARRSSPPAPRTCTPPTTTSPRSRRGTGPR